MSGIKPSQMSAATVAAMKTKLEVMTQAEADLRYPQISEGDPTPIYTTEEVDNLFTTIGTENPVMTEMKQLGISVLSIPMGAYQLFGSNNTMAGGRTNGSLIYFKKSTTVTGFKFFQKVQGDYTASSNNRIGLYSVNPATGALTAVVGGSTVNDGNLWKGTANSIQTKTLAAPISITAGLYAIISLYNSSSQVAAPDLYLFGAAGAPGLTSVVKSQFYQGSQADLTADGTLVGNCSTGGVIYGVWPY